MTAVVAAVALMAPPVGALPVTFQSKPLAGNRVDGVGLAVVQVGSTVYVGGTFTHVRNQAGTTVANRTNLAAFDLATGRVRTTFRADVNGPVRALVSDGRRLFVGGSYTSIGGSSRSRLSAVNLTTGAVDTAFRADVNSNVYSLATAPNRVVVGGSFSAVNGRSRTRLAVVSSSTGALQSFAPTIDNTVLSVAATSDGRRIIAGGSFAKVNSKARKWAAVMDGTSGALAAAQLSPVEGPLLAIVVPGGNAYVSAATGGVGNSANRYRLSDGARMWRLKCDGDGQAIEEHSGTVYGGFHEGCAGDKSVRLTANDSASGARDPNFRPPYDLFWGIRALDGSPRALVVGGEFTVVSGVKVQGFAIFPTK